LFQAEFKSWQSNMAHVLASPYALISTPVGLLPDSAAAAAAAAEAHSNAFNKSFHL
jgi:hypothetical protein